MSDDQKTLEAPVDSPKPKAARRSPAKKAAPKATAPAAAPSEKAEKAPAPTPKKPTAKKSTAPKSADKKPAVSKSASKADDTSAPAPKSTAPAKSAKVQTPVALDLDGAPFDISAADGEKKPRRAAKKPVTAKATAEKTPDSTDTEKKKTAKAAPAGKSGAAKKSPAPKAASTKAQDALPREGAEAPKAAPKPQRSAAKSTATQADTTASSPEAAAAKSTARPAASDTASGKTEAASGKAENDAPQGEDGNAAAPRKSRRGRRGGRGRGRGKAKQAALQAEGQATASEEALAADSPADEREETRARSETSSETGSEADSDAHAESSSAPDAKRQSGRGKAVKPAKGEPKGREPKAKEAKAKDIEAEAKTDMKPGRRKMFISVVPGEQVEVALVEEGAILEYYLEMMHQAKIKGNIYKGVVHNVDTNLQAAFVNYGSGKNGFLQIDEIHPEYFLTPHEAAKGKKFPPIQKVIKAGQEVLVQVVKEPTGNKGAFLTTWLSLAGRFLVLTPGQEQIGVSRKVDNDEERSRLREMMNGIEPGEGLGVIVRTVSAGTSKTTLKNDLQYLKRAWKEIRRKGTSDPAPCLVYQESSLAERAVRDYLTEEVCEVWVDNESVAESLRETVSLLFPRKKDLVRVHVDVRQTLWERFNIQRQLEQIYAREVHLPSGGRLVFDQTEALMAIDINSGKISGKANFESMALKTNLEAAEAIARHLRLRDIGGQVVIDFIEMRDKNHIRDVEKTLRNAMKNDRARHDVARMSSFGLMEIVRQRTGSSALAVTMEPCPCCNGTGIRRNMEWQSLQALRQIGRQARIPGAGSKCVFDTTPELGMYLLNHKRDRLREMEQQLNVTIEIRIQP